MQLTTAAVRDGRKIDGEAERCKDLGQIVVDVRRRVVGIRSRDEPRKASQAVQTGDRIVSEKALKGKALSHHVQYVRGHRNLLIGELISPRLERAKPSKARTTYKTTLAPNAPNPVAVFVFKYRSTGELDPRTHGRDRNPTSRRSPQDGAHHPTNAFATAAR